MKGIEDFQKQCDINGGTLTILFESFILIKAIIPIINLLMQMILDKLGILKFTVVDVYQLLQAN